MTLPSRKITTYADNMKDVPVIPDISGIELLTKMDSRTDNEIKTLHNGLIDDLMSTTDGSSGADNIGSTALKIGGATTVRGQLEELNTGKVDKVDGKGLSSADYTLPEKEKLETVDENANYYTLPVASGSILGGVKQGAGVEIMPDGTINGISAPAPDYVARDAIAAEVTNRTSADTSLSADISSETTNRINADATLAEQISSIKVKMNRDPISTDTAYEFGVQWVNTTNGNTFIRVNNDKIWVKIVSVVPDGKTILPVNDKDIWLACAELTSTKTLAEIVADATLMVTLSASSNAVDYMIRSTGAIMTACVGSVNAMTKLSPTGSYSMEEMITSNDWLTAILASANAIIGLDASANIKIPTSPTSGITSSTPYSGYPAINAFDNNPSTVFLSTGDAVTPSNQFLQFTFSSVMWMYKAMLSFTMVGTQPNVKIDVSADGTTWVNVKPAFTVSGDINFIINTPSKYKAIRIKGVSGTWQSGSVGCQIKEMQVYGK